MLPAHQCLERGEIAAAQVELGLEMQPHLAVADGGTQAKLQVGPVQEPPVEVVIERDHGVPTTLLGLQQRHVGVAQKFISGG